jgi:hypothetical protein
LGSDHPVECDQCIASTIASPPAPFGGKMGA